MSHCVERGKASRQHDRNALVSPETGLALKSANIAVGDWYVAYGRSVQSAQAPLRLSSLQAISPFIPPRYSHGVLRVFALGEA